MTKSVAISIFAACGLAAAAPLFVGCDDAAEAGRAGTSLTSELSAVSTSTAPPDEASTHPVSTAPTAVSGESAPAGRTRSNGNQNVADITFDDIKFPMQKNEEFKRSLITPNIEAMHGARVKIRGYILPSFQQSGLTQFVLVRDNLECCFGPGAMLYDCIIVEMLPGKSTDFTVRPVAVEGVFEVEEYLDFDGVVRAVYHLDGQAVSL